MIFVKFIILKIVKYVVRGSFKGNIFNFERILSNSN